MIGHEKAKMLVKQHGSRQILDKSLYKNGLPFDDSVTDLRQVVGTVGSADRSARELHREKTPIYKNKPIISKLPHGVPLKMSVVDSQLDFLHQDESSSPLRDSSSNAFYYGESPLKQSLKQGKLRVVPSDLSPLNISVEKSMMSRKMIVKP